MNLKNRKFQFTRRTVLYLSIASLAITIGLVTTFCYSLISRYQLTVQHTKEEVLKQDLAHMRQAIKQYSSDKNISPQSLTDLVEAGYIKEVPIDPITGRKDWQIRLENDSAGTKSMVDVRSTSKNNSSIGTPYNEW